MNENDIKYNIVRLSGNIKNVPTERLLFKFGPNETTKGTFYLTKDSANEIIEAWKDYGNLLNIDYNHNQLGDIVTSDEGISAGTYELQIKEDGIYAVNILWTTRAKQMILDKEYLYTSPAFVTEDQNDKEVIIDIINFSLTNLPATKNMDTLIAANVKNIRENMNKQKLGCGKKRKLEDQMPDDNIPTEDIPAEIAPEDIPEAVAEVQDTVEEIQNTQDDMQAQLDAKDAVINDLQAQIADLQAKIDELSPAEEPEDKEEQMNKLKMQMVNEAIACSKIYPTQRELYCSLNIDVLKTELSKLPTKLSRVVPLTVSDDQSDQINQINRLAKKILKKINK